MELKSYTTTKLQRNKTIEDEVLLNYSVLSKLNEKAQMIKFEGILSNKDILDIEENL